MKAWMKILPVLALCAALMLPALAHAEVTSCTLTWTANTETDLKGYRVYESTSSGVYGPFKAEVGKVTMFDCSGVADDKTHFFTVTALDNAGDRPATDLTRNPAGNNESAKSTQVSKLFPIPVPLTFQIQAVSITSPGVSGFEMIPSRPLVTGESFDIYHDGVLLRTEGAPPYCTAQAGTPPVCVSMADTVGTHVIEVRLMVNGVESSRKSVQYTVQIVDIIFPATPQGVTVK